VKAQGLASRRGDDYGKVRNISAGFLTAGLAVVLTQRGIRRHIFSMRCGHEKA
jgi:hypothetical protein